MLAFMVVPMLAASLMMRNSHESLTMLFTSNYTDEANNLMRIATEHELKQDYSQAAHTYMAAGNYFEKGGKLDSAAFAFRASGLLFQRQADEQMAQLAFIRAMEIYSDLPNNGRLREIRRIRAELPNLDFEARKPNLKPAANEACEGNEDPEMIQADLSPKGSYPLGL